MFLLKLLGFLLLALSISSSLTKASDQIIQAAADLTSFTYNGFRSSSPDPNLKLDGTAVIKPNGLLALTNITGGTQQKGHAFYPKPINFKPVDSSLNASVFSFSVTFVFAIASEYVDISGHGMAFLVAPTPGLPWGKPRSYLGLFNETNNGNETNHVIAVEFDTVQNSDLRDLNDNHVGIDINSLDSAVAKPAGYYCPATGNNHDDIASASAPGSHSQFCNLTLMSRRAMQVWVEFDGVKSRMDVTMAPINAGKPSQPLLTLEQANISSVMKQQMYVGFSASTGTVLASHYVLGWSFKINGKAQELDLARLPKLPRIGPKHVSKFLTIGLPLICTFAVFLVGSGVVYYVRRKRKFAEVLEDWELDCGYGPHRFKYKDLYIATKGFGDKELLGTGGFGQVYKGILPASKNAIAVKRVSHQSRQGMREFVAEIVTIGRLRHRNLVQLLGYCRRKEELLLVYEYMPHGSLDKYLYYGQSNPKLTLNWSQRFRIIKGVAAGLLYLHEEWEQVVIHRDIKASNVLLDNNLNGRLGDFGLSRLYDHGSDPQTTHVVGTLGYLAPESIKACKPTTSSDLYAFGAFLLEVTCGRRPMEPRKPSKEIILIDWVSSLYKNGQILQAIDPNLGENIDYAVQEEMEMVLKLGLLCSRTEPTERPSMRQVIQYLEKEIPLPELSLSFDASIITGLMSSTSGKGQVFDHFHMSYPSSVTFSQSSAVSSSFLSGGR